jgi:hypothetical protein
MTQPRRAASPFVALAAVVVAAALSACGGGSEVAPSTPIVEATGMATASIGGASLGGSELVTCGITRTSQAPAVVTDEVVTFTAGTTRLANAPIVAGGVPIELFSGPGRTGTPYQEGTDFTATRSVGVLTRIAGSALPDGTPLYASYTYLASRHDVEIGLTFPAGQWITLTVFNLTPTTPVPVTITASSITAPGDGSLAFHAAAATNLTELATRTAYLLVTECSTVMDPVSCPAANQLVLESFDLTNVLNPCIAGSVRGTLSDENDRDPSNRAVLDATFDDPSCD